MKGPAVAGLTTFVLLCGSARGEDAMNFLAFFARVEAAKTEDIQ